MNSKNNKDMMFITRLIDLTQAQVLKWHSIDRAKVIESEKFSVFGVFDTKHMDKLLRIIGYEKRVSKNSLLSFQPLNFSMEPDNNYEWEKFYILQIIDEAGNVLWVFPQIGPVSDLFESIRRQISGIDNYINKVLAKKSK